MDSKRQISFSLASTLVSYFNIKIVLKFNTKSVDFFRVLSSIKLLTIIKEKRLRCIKSSDVVDAKNLDIQI